MREERMLPINGKPNREFDAKGGASQKSVFENYHRAEGENLPYFGILGEVPKDILWEVINDEEIPYED